MLLSTVYRLLSTQARSPSFENRYIFVLTCGHFEKKWKSGRHWHFNETVQGDESIVK